MSLYEEAWDSFQKEIEIDHAQEPHTHLYTPAGILIILRKHLKKARQEGEEFRKKREKEMEEWYKEIARLADKERQDR